MFSYSSNHNFCSSMKFPSNTGEFRFLGMAFDSFPKATLSATDAYSGHAWNWQLWHSEKMRLGGSVGPQYQLCHLLSDMGQVTSIYLHLNFSSVKGVCVSCGLRCISDVLHIGRVHPAGGRFPGGQVSGLLPGFGYREELVGDRT